MKILKTHTIMILSVMLIMLARCTNKDNDTASPAITDNEITQGNWKVSYFNDSGSDETHKFNGFTFVFGNTGTITATNGSNAQTGTWIAVNDDNQSKLFLTFGNVSPFDELTDDWHNIKQNSSTIELEDVSGGNGGTDYLTFSKI